MTTVTISRDFGSTGDLLARKIAKSLGYHFVDKEIIANLLEKYGFVEFEKEYETQLGFWSKFNAERGKRRELMVEMLNRVLEAFAVHGNVVILGRSGFSVLGGYADVFHIRFHAPFPSRVKRLMQEENLTHVEAATICEDGDKVRAEFVHDYYGVSWDNVQLFDLTLNTDKVPADLASKIAVDCVRAYNTLSKTGKPTTGMLEVDSVLVTAVADLLNCKIDHSESTPILEIQH
jgi:cytidylate kinase